MNQSQKTSTAIKICGVKSSTVALYAARSGASHIGMIFHPSSARNIDPMIGQSIAIAARQGGASPVAVCVDQTATEMLLLCQTMNLRTVQLHGDIARKNHEKLPADISRIYVLHVDQYGTVINLDDTYMQYLNSHRDYLLFDGLSGGTGHTIDTTQLQGAAGDFHYFLAGGMNQSNVCKSIQKCKPYGVDVSTGVENKHGTKDARKIKSFIAQVFHDGSNHE